MKKKERIESIISMLRRENGLPVRTLSRQLGVSHMTTRRDLEEMAADNTVRFIHGGVILTESAPPGRGESLYSLNTAGTLHTGEKRRIGMAAAALIEPEDTIIIDSGSTTEFLAGFLPEDTGLTVICYALNIVSVSARTKNCRQILAGGTFHENTLMFESQEGISLIRRHRATRAFLSAAGVHEDFGVTCSNDYERETKRAVLDSSRQKILLADSSKFGLIRSDYFAELSSFNVIVTDSDLPGRYVELIRDLGIELHLA